LNDIVTCLPTIKGATK